VEAGPGENTQAQESLIQFSSTTAAAVAMHCTAQLFVGMAKGTEGRYVYCT